MSANTTLTKMIEAFRILGVTIIPDHTTEDMLVNRDSMVLAFPNKTEQQVYDQVYKEVSEYIGEPFFWAKITDDHYWAKPRKPH